jgi:hypothetical protein
MSIEAALVNHITDDTAISNLIGTRFYALSIPQSQTGTPQVFPVLTYVIDDNYDIVSLDGPTGKARLRVTFDAYSHELLECINVINAVRKSLNGFVGTLDEGFNVFSCKRDSEASFTRDPRDASNTWDFNKSATFVIGYSYSL